MDKEMKKLLIEMHERVMREIKGEMFFTEPEMSKSPEYLRNLFDFQCRIFHKLNKEDN